MRRATVDLPQPDSPTSESVSPRLMVKDTPSTARRIWRDPPSSTRFSHGRETSKSRARLRTSRSGRLSPAVFGKDPFTSGTHRSLAPILVQIERGRSRRMQPACGAGLARGKKDRALDLAATENPGTPRIERAARRIRIEARQGALDLGGGGNLLPQRGNRPHEARGVGVLGIVDHFLHG